MDRIQLRLECLKVASQLNPGATAEALFIVATKIENYVEEPVKAPSAGEVKR